MQTMENVALGEQKPFIDKINESKVRVMRIKTDLLADEGVVLLRGKGLAYRE